MADPTILAEMTFRSLPLIGKILVGGALTIACFAAAVRANKRVPNPLLTAAAWLLAGSVPLSVIVSSPFPALSRWTFVAGLVTLFAAIFYAGSPLGRRRIDAASYSGSGRS